jgi:hypothetical protein
VSEDEIEEFSKVQANMLRLQQQFAQRVESGEDPGTVRSELDRKAKKLVQESDLTQQRYKQIGRRVQNDPQLRSKVKAQMKSQM